MKLSLAEDLVQEESGSRFLTELDLQIQPLDLILSTTLIHTISSFVSPLSRPVIRICMNLKHDTILLKISTMHSGIFNLITPYFKSIKAIL
jgi:hypothetical protein